MRVKIKDITKEDSYFRSKELLIGLIGEPSNIKHISGLEGVSCSFYPEKEFVFDNGLRKTRYSKSAPMFFLSVIFKSIDDQSDDQSIEVVW